MKVRVLASATITIRDQEYCINQSTFENETAYPTREHERQRELDGEEVNEAGYTFEFYNIKDDEFRNMHPECEEWVSKEKRNINRPFVLKECIQACLPDHDEQ